MKGQTRTYRRTRGHPTATQEKGDREESDRLMNELLAQTDVPPDTYERVMAEWKAIENESLERGSGHGCGS